MRASYGPREGIVSTDTNFSRRARGRRTAKAVAQKGHGNRQTTSADSTQIERPKNVNCLDVASTVGRGASQKRNRCAQYTIKREMVGWARPENPRQPRCRDRSTLSLRTFSNAKVTTKPWNCWRDARRLGNFLPRAPGPCVQGFGSLQGMWEPRRSIGRS